MNSQPQHSYLIVEGAHDCAAIGRLLRISGFRRVDKISNLSELCGQFVPKSYPFKPDELARFSPVPTFYQKDDKHVLIKVAQGDSEIARALYTDLKVLHVKFLDSIRFVGILIDADRCSAAKRKEEIKQKIIDYVDTMPVVIAGNNMRIWNRFDMLFDFFAFPDDQNPGTLEDVLISGAEENYPDLLMLAEDYIKKVPLSYQDKWKNSGKKKALTGVISNVLKPGAPNQASIEDCDWFTEESISKIPTHQSLYHFLKNGIDF